MTTITQRSQVITLVSVAIAAGARQDRACGAISLSERTLQRWQRDQCRGDQRPIRVQEPKNRLSASERQALLAVANSDEFAHLAPSQIVPRLADQGQYIASESSFYRVLRAASQLQHRGSATQQAACAVRNGTQPALQLGHHLFADVGHRGLLLPVLVHGCF